MDRPETNTVETRKIGDRSTEPHVVLQGLILNVSAGLQVNYLLAYIARYHLTTLLPP